MINYESDSDDSIFELLELIAFPQQTKVIRERSDHFQT